MIKYVIKCTSEHAFESWFQSAEAYDDLVRTGRLSCAICGSTEVERR